MKIFGGGKDQTKQIEYLDGQIHTLLLLYIHLLNGEEPAIPPFTAADFDSFFPDRSPYYRLGGLSLLQDARKMAGIQE